MNLTLGLAAQADQLLS